MNIAHSLLTAVVLTAGMIWHVAWSLIFGFTLSGVIQAVVSKERMHEVLGGNGARATVLATVFGAASSSCSYAAAALSKTLFKGGAGLIPSFAFLFASTNLVLELGFIIWLLMGWQFTVAEWLGGAVLIFLMSIVVRLTYPKQLVEAARVSVDTLHAHEHGTVEGDGATMLERLKSAQTRTAIAQNAWMDFSMLWRDLLIGFVIAGVLGAFVPDAAWNTLFLHSASPLVQNFENTLVGPLLAVITFVCSIGNVPTAAILWSSGVSFGGVLAYLYADILILPLLNVYRRYYGWPMAAYMFGVFYVTIAGASFIVDALFKALHAVPPVTQHVRADLMQFSFDYTFYLNVAALCLGVYLYRLQATAEASHHCCHGD